ncbi:MAG: hypothetical protein KC431_07645 [Myxococcales bacterium]|nr:hypothetical protein [Myxococcales bacterium]
MSLRKSIPFLIATLLAGGCNDDFFGIDGDEIGDSSESGDFTPMAGINVTPRYQLIPVSAVVSVEEPAEDPQACGPGGDSLDSYYCDTLNLSASELVVRVERDGYEPVAAIVERPNGYVDVLDVHLVPVGGPVGVWSACVLRDDYPDCDEVCGAEGLVCIETSCATDDPDKPIATVVGFESTDCSGEPSRIEAQACTSAQPAAFTDSLRCCCQG